MNNFKNAFFADDSDTNALSDLSGLSEEDSDKSLKALDKTITS